MNGRRPRELRPTSAPADFGIGVAAGDDGVVVTVCGEVDIATAPTLRSTLVDIEEDRRRGPIVIDLAHVTFIDARGLGVLAAAARRSRSELILRDPSRMVERLVDLTGLRAVLRVEWNDRAVMSLVG